MGGGCLQRCVGQGSLISCNKEPWSPLASHSTYLLLTHITVPWVGRLWSTQSFRAPGASLCLPCHLTGAGVIPGILCIWPTGHRGRVGDSEGGAGGQTWEWCPSFLPPVQ